MNYNLQPICKSEMAPKNEDELSEQIKWTQENFRSHGVDQEIVDMVYVDYHYFDKVVFTDKESVEAQAVEIHERSVPFWRMKEILLAYYGRCPMSDAVMLAFGYPEEWYAMTNELGNKFGLFDKPTRLIR